MRRSTHGRNPNGGAGRSAGRREPPAVSAVELSGELRWVERDGLRAVLQVRGGRGPARRFVQETVTVALDDSRVLTVDRNGDGVRDGADLLPGEEVTVKAALPPGARRLPDLLAARTVVAHTAVPRP